ncbi:type I restriction endonuclease [Nocardioides sp. B-3]|uniref:type I restriction endonuclease n=1 Tax=Nocardioides sp. B-3 TaxID=2895565 RepID=UPI0021530F04|nr:type I restriction endonuclease [Nocardioides sp. B-3]UUZ60568.1 DEAD/DEAH box helicase family protein [Nocardioides sp. B-3]
MNESNTIRAALVGWAEDGGWEHIAGSLLPRLPELTDVVVDGWAREALLSLNPDLVGDPENTDAVLAEVSRAVLLAQDGLVAANEKLTVMLRGEHAFKTLVGKHVPRRFIDFEDLENNRFVVSDEVTIKGGPDTRRMDVVYYVNGFPLVVAETKSPVDKGKSWVNGAKDIWGTYEVEYPHFFAPNVFSVATDGRQLRLAPVRTEPSGDVNEDEGWGPWGSTTDDLKQTQAERVARSVELLLTPATVLGMLHDYAMYRAGSSMEPAVKVLPRYAQLEAAEAIHAKVRTGKRVGKGGGLIWQHQGSGKTELGAFASSRLLRDPAVGNPTVILIAHRKQLVRQAAELFETTGMPRVSVPASKRDLWKAVKNHRGVIVTTVHKFAEAGHLSDRDNIIVIVDEAHDSQEGDFGEGVARRCSQRHVLRDDRYRCQARRPGHVQAVRGPRRSQLHHVPLHP